MIDVATGQHLALLIKEHGLGGRCALVYGNEVFHSKGVMERMRIMMGNVVFLFDEIKCRTGDAFSIHAVVVEDFGVGTMDDILIRDADDTHGNRMFADTFADQ